MKGHFVNFSKKDGEEKYYQMEIHIKANFSEVNRMAKESTHGNRNKFMKANLLKVSDRVSVFLKILMEVLIKEILSRKKPLDNVKYSSTLKIIMKDKLKAVSSKENQPYNCTNKSKFGRANGLMIDLFQKMRKTHDFTIFLINFSLFLLLFVKNSRICKTKKMKFHKSRI